MRRILLSAALLLTAVNLSIGIGYAMTCEGKSGGRVCGSLCQRLPNGECSCEGSCTSAEMKWVAGEQIAE
jgi:hypothetical protein